MEGSSLSWRAGFALRASSFVLRFSGFMVLWCLVSFLKGGWGVCLVVVSRMVFSFWGVGISCFVTGSFDVGVSCFLFVCAF